MKPYPIAHSHDLYVEKSHFSKIEIFGRPTRNSDLSYFSGIFVIFSASISRSGTDVSILNVNNYRFQRTSFVNGPLHIYLCYYHCYKAMDFYTRFFFFSK